MASAERRTLLRRLAPTSGDFTTLFDRQGDDESNLADRQFVGVKVDMARR
jgi:hypothetical protein